MGTAYSLPSPVFRLSAFLMSQRFVLIILCFAVALSLCDTPPATGPQLSVAVSGAGQIELSWPSSAQDFTLEQSSSLGDPNSWGAFPENAIVQGDQYSVTVAGNGNAQFFRLHRLPAPAF